MKKLILLLCVINLSSSYAQSTKNSIDEYISRLNWDALIIAPTYGSKLTIDSNAQKLVLVKDSMALSKLYDNLSQPEKTVVIHMILTKRLEKDKESLSYTASGNSLNYKYNNLSWSYNVKEQRYSIDEAEINKVKRYWCKRLPD
ncbi:MAG: hypothetical protein WKF91_13410 [Segetibacter sp.]